jgi:hypothetical protein
MHSLLNVLAFGEEVSDEDPIDRVKVADVTDLHYLSHFVIRCFEEPGGDSSMDGSSPSNEGLPKRILARTGSSMTGVPVGSKRYTVEVLFCPGVQCKELRENAMCMAPLQSICKQSVCSLDGFDTFLTEILAEFGKLDVSGLPATLAAGATSSSPRSSHP